MELLNHLKNVILDYIPEFLVEKRQTIRPWGPFSIATKSCLLNLFLCEGSSKKVILPLGDFLSLPPKVMF
jgi:hypothetical protein